MPRPQMVVRLRNRAFRLVIGQVRRFYVSFYKMRIGEGTRISLTAKLDKTNPKGVVIGKYSALAFDATVLTHNFLAGRHVETRIGDYCFIGARAIIMPGVTVGDHCIVGAGAVVMKDVPPNSVVLGNPARVMERGIRTGKFGLRLEDRDLPDDLLPEPATAPEAEPV